MMRKALTYSSFVAAGVLVVFAFVTAKTYTQLGVAVILYPLLAFFAYKLFLSNNLHEPSITVHIPSAEPVKKVEVQKAKAKKDETVVVDIDRRTFLKLIGATGLSFFLFSLLGRRVESLFFDRALDSRTPLTGTPSTNSPDQTTPMDGFKISEIDYQNNVTYYGFTNNTGGWLIMKEDAENNSFRYAKGDNRFPDNWTSREQLNYDYFHNLSL